MSNFRLDRLAHVLRNIKLRGINLWFKLLLCWCVLNISFCYVKHLWWEYYFHQLLPKIKPNLPMMLSKKPKVLLSVFFVLKSILTPYFFNRNRPTASETSYSAFKQLYFLFYWFCRRKMLSYIRNFLEKFLKLWLFVSY